jgi:hypothetical protein
MKIRGSALLHSRTFLTSRWGSEITATLIAKLPPGARDTFASQSLSAFSWYPVSIWNAVADEVARWPGKSGALTIRDMAAYVAAQDLTIAHKVLLKLGTPDLVMRQASIFWGTYFNGGSLLAFPAGERRFRLVLHVGVDLQLDPGRLTCREAVPAWQESAIRLAGGYGGRSQHVKCRFEGSASCEYDVRWIR